MFTLVKGAWDYLSKRPSFNIVIVGLDNAGKTTLLEQIKCLLSGTKSKTELPETVPTIGQNVSKCEFHGVTCQFWDLGGAGNLRQLWTKYYAEAHAVLFVLDSTDGRRLQEVISILESLMINDEAEGVPVAILANKQDLGEAAMDFISIKETFNPVMAHIGARESKVFSVSAKTGNGVIETLEWLLGAVKSNSIHRPPNLI